MISALLNERNEGNGRNERDERNERIERNAVLQVSAMDGMSERNERQVANGRKVANVRRASARNAFGGYVTSLHRVPPRAAGCGARTFGGAATGEARPARHPRQTPPPQRSSSRSRAACGNCFWRISASFPPAVANRLLLR